MTRSAVLPISNSIFRPRAFTALKQAPGECSSRIRNENLDQIFVLYPISSRSHRSTNKVLPPPPHPEQEAIVPDRKFFFLSFKRCASGGARHGPVIWATPEETASRRSGSCAKRCFVWPRCLRPAAPAPPASPEGGGRANNADLPRSISCGTDLSAAIEVRRSAVEQVKVV